MEILDYSGVQSKKCNVRLPYVKHALNVSYKTYVQTQGSSTIRLPFVFYRTLYMRFEKHAFNAWVEKPTFYHPLKSLMLTYYNPCIKIDFLETYV